MKSLKQFNLNVWLILVSVMGIIASCKKNDPNKDLSAPRLFKPSGISVKTSATSAKITWTPSLFSTGQKLTYTTQFSQDSTFATSEFTLQTDTAGLTVTDDKITLRKKYYMRLKANAYQDQPESNWVTSSGFTIVGEQFFQPVRDLELKETAVTLRWNLTAGLTTITLSASTGNPTSYPISASDATAGFKLLTGLTAGTDYTAELFAGTKSKGLLKFSTQGATVYSVVLNSGADLVAAINAAANNAVIGLNPGSYSAGSANFILLQKTVTIKSTSGNPTDTKVNFKEFDLKGNGAGINFAGIELDGTASGALYFINPTGVLVDAEKCAYTQVTLNNCIVHGATTSFMRANRGAAGGDYSMDNITVRNCVIYDIASTLGYTFLHLDKLQFNTLTFTNTTIYNFGRELLSCSTALTSTPPTITFDYCTLNNFGSTALYILMDANANPVKFNMTNSIIANVPRPGGAVQGVVLRANGAGSATVFNNNNTFNFTNGAGVALIYPTANITMIGNQSVNLGWTATTTDFTLPAGSPLRTASNVSTPIGDPRWSY